MFLRACGTDRIGSISGMSVCICCVGSKPVVVDIVVDIVVDVDVDVVVVVVDVASSAVGAAALPYVV